MKRFDYHQPDSLGKAFDLMEKLGKGAKYVAGGTDVIVRIKQRAIQSDALISLRGIEILKGFEVNGEVSIGSMTLFRDIERSGELRKACPALVEAVAVLANPQVRNVATPGGNISNAAPSADCAPPLLVMEAVLTVEGPGGKREIPIEDFFVGPGQTVMAPTEILTRVRFSAAEKGTGTAFLKVGRTSQDIAIANAAALVEMEGKKCRKCRIAAGAVAPVPLRLEKVEALLEDSEVDAELLDEAARVTAKEVQPITDVRSTEEYRRHISGVLVKKAIQRAVERAR
jgi:CO/xanthine dehydrogenase FAD-binding subunit